MKNYQEKGYSKPGIRYTRSNGILHIVIGRYHAKLSRAAGIIENCRTHNARWLWGWN